MAIVRVDRVGWDRRWVPALCLWRFRPGVAVAKRRLRTAVAVVAIVSIVAIVGQWFRPVVLVPGLGVALALVPGQASVVPVTRVLLVPVSVTVSVGEARWARQIVPAWGKPEQVGIALWAEVAPARSPGVLALHWTVVVVRILRPGPVLWVVAGVVRRRVPSLPMLPLAGPRVPVTRVQLRLGLLQPGED